MSAPITKGTHHVGLTVSNLEGSAAFFTSLLGWREVRRNEDYPAIYVSDGNTLVTLWATKEALSIPFDKNQNVGLHHVAFHVNDEADLHTVHQRLTANGAKIEFGPELLGQGPAKHLMCYEPSGIRVEFVWPGN